MKDKSVLTESEMNRWKKLANIHILNENMDNIPEKEEEDEGEMPSPVPPSTEEVPAEMGSEMPSTDGPTMEGESVSITKEQAKTIIELAKALEALGLGMEEEMPPAPTSDMPSPVPPASESPAEEKEEEKEEEEKEVSKLSESLVKRISDKVATKVAAKLLEAKVRSKGKK
jgi:hypothetical protein